MLLRWLFFWAVVGQLKLMKDECRKLPSLNTIEVNTNSSFFELDMYVWFTRDYHDTRFIRVFAPYAYRTLIVINRTEYEIIRLTQSYENLTLDKIVHKSYHNMCFFQDIKVIKTISDLNDFFFKFKALTRVILKNNIFKSHVLIGRRKVEYQEEFYKNGVSFN